MTITDFVGYWESKDFPFYAYNDGLTFRLDIHSSLGCSLWFSHTKDGREQIETLSKGKISIINNRVGGFDFSIDGIANNNKYLLLETEIFLDKNTLVIDLHSYGRRHFTRLG